jgi:glucose-1-phosphate thymidylyltransferase
MNKEIIGLLPAAGKAKRISPLPCSKEIYPINVYQENHQKGQPKVCSHYLIQAMKNAGAQKLFIILRKGKWDIPAYFEDGRAEGVTMAYLMMGRPYGVPYTLDQAYPFINNAIICFGFPDIIFSPMNAFTLLLDSLKHQDADVTLGLFRAHNTKKMDMVNTGSNGKIRNIEIKPSDTQLLHTWIIAVWRPAFTEFMHHLLQVNARAKSSIEVNHEPANSRELFLGDVFIKALDSDLKINTVFFPDGKYLDIGTPEDLIKINTFNHVITGDGHDYR